MRTEISDESEPARANELLPPHIVITLRDCPCDFPVFENRRDEDSVVSVDCSNYSLANAEDGSHQATVRDSFTELADFQGEIELMIDPSELFRGFDESDGADVESSGDEKVDAGQHSEDTALPRQIRSLPVAEPQETEALGSCFDHKEQEKTLTQPGNLLKSSSIRLTIVESSILPEPDSVNVSAELLDCSATPLCHGCNDSKAVDDMGAHEGHANENDHMIQELVAFSDEVIPTNNSPINAGASGNRNLLVQSTAFSAPPTVIDSPMHQALSQAASTSDSESVESPSTTQPYADSSAVSDVTSHASLRLSLTSWDSRDEVSLPSDQADSHLVSSAYEWELALCSAEISHLMNGCCNSAQLEDILNEPGRDAVDKTVIFSDLGADSTSLSERAQRSDVDNGEGTTMSSELPGVIGYAEECEDSAASLNRTSEDQLSLSDSAEDAQVKDGGFTSGSEQQETCSSSDAQTSADDSDSFVSVITFPGAIEDTEGECVSTSVSFKEHLGQLLLRGPSSRTPAVHAGCHTCTHTQSPGQECEMKAGAEDIERKPSVTNHLSPFDMQKQCRGDMSEAALSRPPWSPAGVSRARIAALRSDVEQRRQKLRRAFRAIAINAGESKASVRVEDGARAENDLAVSDKASHHAPSISAAGLCSEQAFECPRVSGDIDYITSGESAPSLNDKLPPTIEISGGNRSDDSAEAPACDSGEGHQVKTSVSNPALSVAVGIPRSDCLAGMESNSPSAYVLSPCSATMHHMLKSPRASPLNKSMKKVSPRSKMGSPRAEKVRSPRSHLHKPSPNRLRAPARGGLRQSTLDHAADDRGSEDEDAFSVSVGHGWEDPVTVGGLHALNRARTDSMSSAGGSSTDASSYSQSLTSGKSPSKKLSKRKSAKLALEKLANKLMVWK